MRKDGVPALVFVAVLASCSLIVGTDFLHAQERNRMDRPKDVQELCGYELKQDQVVSIGRRNSYVKLGLPGLVQDHLAVFEKAVCAFKAQNPDIDPVSVFMTYVDAQGAALINMVQRGDSVEGILLVHGPRQPKAAQ